MHYYLRYVFFGFLLLFAWGCSREATTLSFYQEIAGRDQQRKPIYRVKVPANWIRKDLDLNDSLEDTTKALCEFFIPGSPEPIRITIHNFPIDKPSERIPPNAQIARWKRQFTQLDPLSVSITSQSYSGFAGQFFEGKGILSDKSMVMMAWAMQLAPEHVSTLSLNISMALHHSMDASIYRQMRADVTIKATGQQELMEQQRQAIISFAHSFELIQEIPSSI